MDITNKRTASDGRLCRPVPRGLKDPLALGFAWRLSVARCRLGLAAAHLGLAAGLHDTTVGALEDGKSIPKLDTVEKIAAALGVTPCWLAFGEQGAYEFKQRRPRSPVPPEPPEPVAGGLPFLSLHSSVGERLLKKREELGLSLRALAESAGVSFETIRKCEAGSAIPKVDTCERLAVALGVAPCWLAFGVGEAK